MWKKRKENLTKNTDHFCTVFCHKNGPIFEENIQFDFSNRILTSEWIVRFFEHLQKGRLNLSEGSIALSEVRIDLEGRIMTRSDPSLPFVPACFRRETEGKIIYLDSVHIYTQRTEQNIQQRSLYKASTNAIFRIIVTSIIILCVCVCVWATSLYTPFNPTFYTAFYPLSI